MKLAKFIYKNSTPFSLDFGDTFYHDGARLAEREEVYIAPAFALAARQSAEAALDQLAASAKPTASEQLADVDEQGVCLHFPAPQFASSLRQIASRAEAAPELASLPGENFNAYLKAAPERPSDAPEDTLAHARAVLADIGALDAFELADRRAAKVPLEAKNLQTTPTAPSTAAPQPGTLAILEIGFGFALNFLLAYARAERENRRIYYAAAESHYVPARELAAHAAALGLAVPPGLLAAYPPRAHGAWRIELAHATLDLFFGDAREILPRLSGAFDAVFFDIFAGQSALYDALLPHCARLCRGRIFSFLANSHFKKSLASAGFVPEFCAAAHKREVCASAPKVPASSANLHAKTALIIGAGIAGLLAARELARAGVSVRLLEASGVASGGSSNILGQISHACHSPASALGEFQYLGACAAFRAFLSANEVLAVGGIERAASEQISAQMARCRYPLARKIPGGRFLLAGATISPKFACERLARGLEVLRERVVAVRSEGSRAVAECASGARYEADALIIAAGCGTIGALDAPLSAVRGQVCWIASRQRRALSERAYVTAARGGVAVLGATYERFSFSLGLESAFARRSCQCSINDHSRSPQSHRQLRHAKSSSDTVAKTAIDGGLVSSSNSPRDTFAKAASGGDLAGDDAESGNSGECVAGLRDFEADMLLSAAGLSRANLLAMKSGWRCYSGDRFPLIGEIAPRVFASCAHGSRGLSTAILSARILAEQIAGAPSGVYADLAAECDPKRFERRRAKKGR